MPKKIHPFDQESEGVREKDSRVGNLILFPAERIGKLAELTP
jgi:hypothetical protein